MTTRREILKKSLRWTGLASLAGLATLLGHRSIRQQCTNAGPCGGCPQFSGCGLPKAESAKQSQANPPYSPDPGNV